MNQESLERQSGIDRIVDASPEQEAEVLKHFRGLFENNDPTYYERGKNEADAEIIRDVLYVCQTLSGNSVGRLLLNLGLSTSTSLVKEN